MEKKVVLITGASTGFGKLAAETLAKEGKIVYASMRNINGRNADKAKELMQWATSLSLNLKTIELDVTSEQSIQGAVQTIIDSDGHIDVLVNNAGGGGMGLTEDFTIDELKNQFDVNVFGLFATTKAVIPQMRKQKKGLLVNVSSGFGRAVLPMFHVYCSSKYAMEALSEGWRYELSQFGIDSVIVEPGAFPTTDFGKNMETFSPKTKNSLSEYGVLAHLPEGFSKNLAETIENGTANDPQLVADAISVLIATPNGERPLRTVVDPMMEGALNPLNDLTDNIQKGMLGWMQLQDLQQVPATVE